MSSRFRIAIPLAALVMLATLMHSPAQPPKSKSKSPDSDKAIPAVTVFEVYQDRGGEYRFRMKHGDTSLAIAGKGYESKAECRRVIETIKKDAATARIVDAP
jgi:uncharacterized protein YegP (UPF0339 family)